MAFEVNELERRIGQEIFVSDWVSVSQREVDAFAAVTRDPDPMHVDPEYARRCSPYGTTVLFGFQTLSMLTHLSGPLRHSAAGPNAYELNYGLNRVRFIEPIPVDRRFRNRVTLKSLQIRNDGSHLITTVNTIEIEGGSRPAVVAEWIGLVARPLQPV